MKLNLNAKEFLALYNNLYEHTVGAGSTDPHLKEVFNRMKSCIVSALSARDQSALELEQLYFKGQREKIDRLKDRNKEISKTLTILTEDVDDPVMPSDYPRKVSIVKGHRKKG